MDSDLASPPRLPGGIPWLGHAASFGRDPVTFLRGGQAALGDVFSFRMLGQSVVFLTGPEAHEAVFRAPDDLLSAKEAYRFMTPVFGKGVAYDVEPQLMDEQIGLVLPAVTARRMQVYAEVMEAEARAFLGSWADQGEIDLPATMNKLTVALAARCLFGTQVTPGMLAELPGLYHDLGSGIRLGGLVNPYLPLPPFRRRDRARERIKELIAQMMELRRRQGEAEAHDDFLATLMRARYADGSALSDDAIAGLILTIIFAGQHTTAALATWTGVLLLENPGRLPALLAEQADVFGADQAITVPKLHRLELLDRCVKEAERMRPPLVVLMRVALETFQHKGYQVQPGTLVMVSPGVSHRSAAVFRDPDVYDPDRFGPDRAEDRRTPYALIGFGGGKHRCIGMAFAYQQAKVIWSLLLRHFELDLVRRPNPPVYGAMMSAPKSPCRLRYRRLTGQGATTAAP